MSGVFLNVVNMSISATWLILAVLIIRFPMKKAPRKFTVLLWGIVAVRLVCPFNFESAVSLVPSARTISKLADVPRPYFESGIAELDSGVNEYLKSRWYEGVTRPADHFTDITSVFAVVWLIGIAIFIVFTAVSYLKVKKKVETAVLLRDNIFQSENVSSPFVLGIIKPKIYLPFNITEQDAENVIAHEKAHIARRDFLWKPLGFLILALHWLNPFVWLGYILLCRDIEFACDEKVVVGFTAEEKADYSRSLLNCSTNRKTGLVCPLAFGEVGVKNRIKSVLNCKKPAFWIITVATVAVIAVALCFLTNPKTSVDDNLSAFITDLVAEENRSDATDENYVTVNIKVLGTEKSFDRTIVYMWALYQEFSDYNGQVEEVAGSYCPTAVTVKKKSDGDYELVEYWTPEDGMNYGDDIDGKFPWHLRRKALDPSLFIDELESAGYKAAENYFGGRSYREVFDIDGDGKDEECAIGRGGYPGPSFSLWVHEVGAPVGSLEYLNFYPVSSGSVFFEEINGETFLRAEIDGKTSDLSFRTSGNSLILVSDSEIFPTDTIKNIYKPKSYGYEYYETQTGLWVTQNRIYEYCLKLSGRMSNAAKETTFTVLSNYQYIDFNETVLASGLGSSSENYWDSDFATIVDRQ